MGEAGIPLNYFILGILPYITISVFLIAMVYRVYTWFKTPQPGAMTLFPAPEGGTATFLGVIKESFLFPNLFKGDRALWISAWLFHAALALIAIGHVRVFTDFPRLWAALGINADRMSAVSGGTAGLLIFLCLLFLIFRRLIIRRVREVSNLPDYFTLLLILAILFTGNMMRFGEHFDLEITRRYFSSLFTLSLTETTVPANGLFTFHFLLGQLLLLVIPFSKIMHLGGIFFTQTLVQKA